MRYILIVLITLMMSCSQPTYFDDASTVVGMLEIHTIQNCEPINTEFMQSASALTCNLNHDRFITIHVFDLIVSEHCLKVRAACSGGRIWDKQYMQVSPLEKPMRLTRDNVILDIFPKSEDIATPTKTNQEIGKAVMSAYERSELSESIMEDLDSNIGSLKE